ncbi:unnamed protein product [Rotaria sp. Silwood1]|nr:unnamed protein product [Rotaria sp. Silwood1]CAF0902080.1 unnamed protein product [Rotaria sp. Silwood1]CAF3377881.1 unnamed protein product [Rotaria sp. Silwood1]CAF4617833.1 unnamed protein product [Rotaria sp. Silwood1]
MLLIAIYDPDIHSTNSTFIVRSEDQNNENNKSLDSTISIPNGIQQSTVPKRKSIVHQFYNVYAGMSDEEWTKTRDAFIAAYFKK